MMLETPARARWLEYGPGLLRARTIARMSREQRLQAMRRANEIKTRALVKPQPASPVCDGDNTVGATRRRRPGSYSTGGNDD